ncbi:activating transcription factor 7-interacting protein 2 [Embiotoca jacksoni]|uniref:activating transcription factor 7-interacting protein 2 n=1 Tax=Embiotoca jacksoni TaxID=100190 RepID=UPI0037041387
MKRLSPTVASAGASDEKIKFSKLEVRALIQQEVRKEIKEKESKILSSIETIQYLDAGFNFKDSIQKLEARVDTLRKRAEAALAFMTRTQKESPLLPLVESEIITVNADDETMGTMSQTKKSLHSPAKSEVFQIMETTKKALKKMQADNKALRTAIADLNVNQSRPLTPYAPPTNKGLVEFSKEEPQDWKEKANNNEESKQHEKPKDEKVEVKCTSHDAKNPPRRTDSTTQQFLCPPLPPTTFPSVLSTEATLYNIPPKLQVHLALIRNPNPSLSVLWNVVDEDPSAPPMDSYTVYLTMEKEKGSGVFPDWNILSEVTAIALPMFVLITKYKPGHKVCAAVVGKDKFGRYGPYSDISTAAIPD